MEQELALSSDTALEFRGRPYDPAARRLYGVPVVVANVEAADTAHLIGNGADGVDDGKSWSR